MGSIPTGGRINDALEHPLVETDVLIVGSGPSGATYARKLVDAGINVFMIEMGAQETLIPGDHKKNNSKVQKDLSNFTNIVKGELELLSVPTSDSGARDLDPSSWSIDPTKATIHNGQNPHQDPYKNLDASAATRTVGGMATHWTCCTPRQHPVLERSDLFNDAEWDQLYTEAEYRIKTNSHVFDDSIRQQLVQRTLEGFTYGNGPREFEPMPLAVQDIEGQTYLEWSSSSTVFGDITRSPDRQGSPHFTLKSQVRCTRVIRDQSGDIQYALCKDLTRCEKNEFLVKAKKYILCAGAVLTPGILYNSGWKGEENDLPVGKYLTEQTMAFCQIVLKRSLVDEVWTDPYHLGWAEKARKHHAAFPCDPLPFPFDDKDPQVYTPVSENYPWHTQIHRDAFGYGQVPSTVDQRLIVDLRWFGWISPVRTNQVCFTSAIKDQYGMPQPTFNYEVPTEDAKRAHDMMADMCEVAGKLGGFLPGAEPKFLLPGSALHVSGTVRAGTDRATSVCDRYGKVWGTGNLYVGGCGVIPTGAACNPTLTAMAFAIAGADSIILEMTGCVPVKKAV